MAQPTSRLGLLAIETLSSDMYALMTDAMDLASPVMVTSTAVIALNPWPRLHYQAS